MACSQYLAGEEGLEPSNAGIKIRCLNRLGDSPKKLFRYSVDPAVERMLFKTSSIPCFPLRRTVPTECGGSRFGRHGSKNAGPGPCHPRGGVVPQPFDRGGNFG